MKRQINIRLSWRKSVEVGVKSDLIAHNQALGLQKKDQYSCNKSKQSNNGSTKWRLSFRERKNNRDFKSNQARVKHENNTRNLAHTDYSLLSVWADWIASEILQD